MLAGIFVKKLKTASEPTATIAGTLRPKIRMGRSKTPPPSPVRPMRVPTKKPTRILAANKGITIPAISSVADLASWRDGRLARPGGRGRPPLHKTLGRRSVYANKTLLLEMQDDLLSSFFGRKFHRVDYDLGFLRCF